MVLGGVGAREYRGMDSFVASLDAERGDVLAQEWNDYSYQPTPDLVLGRAICRAEGSPYIDPVHFDGLVASAGPQEDTIAIPSAIGDPVHFSIPNMLALLEAAAALRIMDPFEHAAVRATLRGIPCKIADASKEDGLERGDPRRDLYIVRDLGEHAITMQSVGGQRPRLGYNVGSRHESALREILGTNDIPFASVTIKTTPFTPVRRKLEMGSLLLGSLTGRIDRIEDIWIKKWVANARKQTANGLL